MANKIIAISDINVQIFSELSQDFEIGDILGVKDNSSYQFEVVEINNNIITAIPLSSVRGLKRNLEIWMVKQNYILIIIINLV